MEKETKCPCCPRGCDLSQPHCPRGEEYAKTGVIPEGHGHGHGPHGHGGPHGHSLRLQFEKPEQQRVMKYLHHAVGAADRGLTQEQAGEMFAVLTPEETETLATLLEKLANHWGALGGKSVH